MQRPIQDFASEFESLLSFVVKDLNRVINAARFYSNC